MTNFIKILVHFEYIKPNKKTFTNSIGNYSNSSKLLKKLFIKGMKNNFTLIKKETSCYSINIPILKIPKQIEISSNVLTRNSCARIADLITNACSQLKE